MNKYNNPRLTNTTIAGSGMKHPVRPHVIIGDPKNGYIQGDLMDANAVKEIAKEIVDNAPEALDTLKELADAIQENGVADLVTKELLEASLANKVDQSDMVEGDANGHEYVDLGLPSGTLWATMNVGASSETDAGLYFAWGETEGYADASTKAFSWSDYKWTEDSGSTMSKYNATDGKIVLDLEDDAVAVNWGGSWKMPTLTQVQELLNTSNCTNIWTTVNGVNGRLFTSVTNGNTLFIPAAGNALNGHVSNVDSSGFVLSSSLFSSGSKSGRCLSFGSFGVYMDIVNRCNGHSVRGVINIKEKYATKAEVEQLQSNIVQSDWNLTDSTAIDYIKNKPDLSKYVLQSDMVESDANGHDYVEIGGIKWATMNIGANSVTDTGLYFQWGDTQGYTASQCGSGEGLKAFSWADYKYGAGINKLTKYNKTDGKLILEAIDDAAANWGGSWRTPTNDEYIALGNAVDTRWTTNYQGSGVAGMICTDKTDNSKTLFFPAVGQCRGSVASVGDIGYYWSSSIVADNMRTNASSIRLDNSNNAYWNTSSGRFEGIAIRGVLGGRDKYATKAEVKQLQSNLEARVAALEQAAQS